MERKNSKISVELPSSLDDAFHHKLIDEHMTVKAVVRQLIELWVKGEIMLSNKPDEPAERKRPKVSG